MVLASLYDVVENITERGLSKSLEDIAESGFKGVYNVVENIGEYGFSKSLENIVDSGFSRCLQFSGKYSGVLF